MKTFYTTLLAISCYCLPTTSKAQEEKLVFKYDGHGNLIERKLQVFPLFRLSNQNPPADSTIKHLPQHLNIFPNPTDDKITVEGSLPEDIKRAEITLINSVGQVMLKDYYFGIPKSIPVSDLGNGIYILSFKYSQKEQYAYKIVVAH
jgi:hypothetical protein